MKNRNICKFVAEDGSGTLFTTRFIFETRWESDTEDRIAPVNRLLLVTNGNGVYAANGKSTSLKAGMLLVIPSGQCYRLQNGGDLQFLYIDYTGQRSGELHARFGIGAGNCLFETDKSLIPLWKESLIRADAETLDLLSESMLLYAFSRIKAPAGGKTETIRLVVSYIGEHYSDSSLTLAGMAKDLGYNAKYLSHLITVQLGIGFSQYVTELRLRQSILLIRQGLTSVRNISILCGFGDPFYFSKVFKEKFGVSPKAFIQKENPYDGGQT